MCGEQTPSLLPRVGARVDFFSPPNKQGMPGGHLPRGNLLFLNPSSPTSSHATHIRFHQPPPSQTQLRSLDDSQDKDDHNLLVSIHLTGDLTKPLADSGLMQQFTLRHSYSSQASHPTAAAGPGGGVEMALGAALSLNVGSDGIIGRRVSMRRGEELVADGIVGFNSERVFGC